LGRIGASLVAALKRLDHAAAGKGIPRAHTRAKSQGFAREIHQTLRKWIFTRLG